MPKFITELRQVLGMVRDLLKINIPKNRYYSAENINLTPNHQDSIGGATTMLGSTYAFEFGKIDIANNNNDYQSWMVENSFFSNATYNITLTGLAPFSITTVGFNVFSTYNSFKIQLEAATASIGGVVSRNNIYTMFGFKAYGAERDFTITRASVPLNPIITKEFFGTTCNGAFEPLKSFDIGENLFIISTNGSVFRYAVAKKDFVSGTWTYTVLLETKQLVYATDAVIDMDGQIDFGDRVSMYFTGKGYAPRCIYVKLQDTWVANSCMQYYDSITENTDGYYVYNTLEQSTRLQTLENYARITSYIVNNSGGALTSGNKQYFIRQYVGDDNASGVGVGSALIPIFSDSLLNTSLSGDNGGVVTGKSITLNIIGLNQNLYSKFDLICLENTNGIFTARIVDKYNISSDTITITDNGGRISDFSPNELATQQVLIKDASNLVIARNRLFISNITTQQDFDLKAWAKTITVNTAVEEFDAIGAAQSSVNEYMKPDNYNRICYQEYETYRFGIQLFYKNGYVSSPYFIKDHKFIRPNTLVNENALTDFSNVNTVETVYALKPEFTVNLSTVSIDGVPLNELVSGFSIVRQECIQEAWGGLIMPSTNYVDGAYVAGTYTVLRTGRYLPFLYPPNQEKFLHFYCPDVNFNISSINPFGGHKIYNYGCLVPYNYIQEDGDDTRYILSEFSGRTGLYTMQELNVLGGGLVPFNTKSSATVYNGAAASTIVGAGATVPNNSIYGNNQQILAIRTDVDLADYTVGPPADLPSFGLNYAVYYAPIDNKYGNEDSGLYQSTGHYQEVGSGTSFTFDVFGGDTFVQKNYTKFCNLAYLDENIPTLTLTRDGTAVNPFTTGNTLTYYLCTDYASLGIPSVTERTITFSNIIIAFDATSGVKIQTTFPLTSDIPLKIIRYSLLANEYTLIADGLTGYGAFSYTDLNNNPPVTSAPPNSQSLKLKTKWGISYYTSNRGNYQLRYFNDSDTDLNYPYQTPVLSQWFEDDLSSGQYNYSVGYSPLQAPQTLRLGYNSSLPLDTSEQNVLLYSELKLTGSLADNYRLFLPLNRKEYSANFGAITNTFVKDMNYLVIFMDEMVIYQPLDQQQNQTQADGTNIIIGDGTVLGAREQTISNIGSPYKTMAITYTNSRGMNHMSWFNPRLKKWMRYTGALNDIGEECGVQSFLTENTDYLFGERSIIFGYDFINNELLMTARYDNGAPVWVDNIQYFDGEVVSYQPQDIDQPHFFMTNTSVPLNKNPYLPENQVQYWSKLVQSNFTLAYNDKLNVASDFKDFLPSLYLMFNNTFLSKATVSGINQMYEHNRGVMLYDNTEIISSITLIFNDLSDFYKTYRTVYSDITIRPYFIKIKSSEFVTYADTTNFSFIRPHFGVNVYNDARINIDNPDGLNTLFTARPSGQVAEVTLYFKNNSVNELATLRKIILSMIPKPKFFNN